MYLGENFTEELYFFPQPNHKAQNIFTFLFIFTVWIWWEGQSRAPPPHPTGQCRKFISVCTYVCTSIHIGIFKGAMVT